MCDALMSSFVLSLFVLLSARSHFVVVVCFCMLLFAFHSSSLAKGSWSMGTPILSWAGLSFISCSSSSSSSFSSPSSTSSTGSLYPAIIMGGAYNFRARDWLIVPFAKKERTNFSFFVHQSMLMGCPTTL